MPPRRRGTNGAEDPFSLCVGRPTSLARQPLCSPGPPRSASSKRHFDYVEHRTFVGWTLQRALHRWIYGILKMNLLSMTVDEGKGLQSFSIFFLKSTLALLTGSFTGLVGFFNNLAVENVACFKMLLSVSTQWSWEKL